MFPESQIEHIKIVNESLPKEELQMSRNVNFTCCRQGQYCAHIFNLSKDILLMHQCATGSIRISMRFLCCIVLNMKTFKLCHASLY